MRKFLHQRLCRHASMAFMRSALVVALLAVPAIAHAHIHLLQPLSRTDDATGNPQKEPHCGGLASANRIPARVTTFKPGQTIDVTFRETVPHMGWYRVSFQPNGQTFFIPPAGQGPPSNYPDNATGTTDAGTGTIVLMDRIPDVAQNIDTTVQITLPNMECDNCTLQFMQVMTDTATYDGDPDLYFNCADITLANDAPDAGVQTGGDDAGVDGGGGSNNVDPGMVSGGCSAGGGAGLALSLLGLAGLRRRRRA